MDEGFYGDVVKLKQRLDAVEEKLNMLVGLIARTKRKDEDISRVIKSYMMQCFDCCQSRDKCEDCDIGIVIEALEDQRSLINT